MQLLNVLQSTLRETSDMQQCIDINAESTATDLIPNAVLKWSFVTAMELRISASMFSSSRSMTSIFSLMHCSAASVHRAARSAPT